jgi:hypothetical protein
MVRGFLTIVGTVALCGTTAGIFAPMAKGQDQQSDQQQNQNQGQNQGQAGQQPEQSQAPIPAYRSPLASAAGDNDETGPQTLTPDTTSLSGAQSFTLGTPVTHSYWQPHVDIFITADSNGAEVANGGSNWGAETSISGGVDLHRISGNNDLSLSYISGGVFSNEGGVGDGVVQGLNVGDKMTFRRATVSLFNQLQYLPESALGYGGLGGTTLGSGSTGLGGTLNPGQSILVGQGQNLQDSAVGEVDTLLTARTSLTFLGGYSFLHYFSGDLFNYNDFNFRFGYNYQWTRKDTIAAFYTFTGFRYSTTNQSIDAHTFQVSYGRRVTGKLAFQVAAGPQFVISRIPVTGTTTEPTTGTNSTQILWSLNTALTWQTGRNVVSGAYQHGVSGGGGVLAGALGDTVTGSLIHQVSRTFSDGLLFGYSRNSGQEIAGLETSGTVNQAFDYWFVGATASHPIGRTLGLTFTYQLQYQTGTAAFCIAATCGTDVIRNLISVGIGWHERPLTF